jgi:hypothetical protein
MNINELFTNILSKFSTEDLCGEFTLEGNCIVWTYILDNYDNTDDIRSFYCDDEEDDLLDFNFESTSSEELLLEAYDTNFQKIEALLDELDETENWTISEPETTDDTISFKIF